MITQAIIERAPKYYASIIWCDIACGLWDMLEEIVVTALEKRASSGDVH